MSKRGADGADGADDGGGDLLARYGIDTAQTAAKAAKNLGIECRRFAGPSQHGARLQHLRVVHLTDLHVGRVTPDRVQQAAAELSNALEPDLIVITGDFVCHSQRYLDQLSEVVARFDAPVMGVLGNHDYWSGADEVRWALRRGGVELLDNVHTTITLRGQRLQVVGLDDAYTGHADVAKAVHGLRKDIATIGLSHIAEEADALWAAGVPMVFSGHTHAGQVTVARLHEFILGQVVGHRYVHGLYGNRDGDALATRDSMLPGSVYVGAGIGAAVVPIRLGARARREVAVFELGLTPGSFSEDHSEQVPLPGRPPSARALEKRRIDALRKVERRRRQARRRGVAPFGGKSGDPSRDE